MKKISYGMTAIVVAMFLLAGAAGWAQDIKARMKERLPALIILKAKGVIGENNLGYLQFVAANKEKEAVVAAENADRQIAYQEIAKQQGTTAELVGKRRALKLAEMAAPGDWLQNEAGQWVKK